MEAAGRRSLDFMLGVSPSLRRHCGVVLNRITVEGPLTRKDLTERLGWSRTTLSRAVSALIDSGLLLDDLPVTAHGRGRPESPLRIGSEAGAMIGVDLGFSSVRVLLARPDHSVIAFGERTLWPEYGAGDGFGAAAEIAQQLLDGASIDWSSVIGAGFAVGAPIESGTNTVALSSLAPTWGGDIHAWARRYFPCQVAFGNKSRLDCYAELNWGSGRDLASFISVTLHSGVGGAVVIDRAIVPGSTGTAGEIGHMIVDSEGLPCRCGRRGCLETIAGVPAILSTIGNDASWSSAVARLSVGETSAVEAFTNAYVHVGRALGSLCNVLNPQAVVIGGALSRASGATAREIAHELNRSLLPSSTPIEVRVGELGRRASALGAAGMMLMRAIT